MQRLKFITYTANGSFTAPPGITNLLLFGRGGSAGGGGTGTTGVHSVQGGGGCWSTFLVVSVVPNTTYTITIGAGGTGGDGGDGYVTVGGPGNDSTFGSLATFRGATAVADNEKELSHGLTFGGNGSGLSGGAPAIGHQLLGGQRSPFAVGGTGSISGTLYRGGGGAGDGAGGNASASTTGSNGVSGGGGGAGKTTGGNGSDGQIIVAYLE